MSDFARFTAPVLLFSVLVPSLACSSAPSTDGSNASTHEALSAPLSWVGSTQVAYPTLRNGPVGTAGADEVVPASFVVASRALDVVTDTYPEGSAASVTLYWANADYTSTGSVPMTFTNAGDGTYGNNDRFVGTLPASALQAGAAIHYWIAAVGSGGETLYDSQNGANYTLTPRAVSVGWGGDFGAYDAKGGLEFYKVGELFNADLSTTVGCFEDGADDYAVQALQVYVPGLTDQGYTGTLADVAGWLIQAQLWTDMLPGGWGAVPMSCGAGIGNNDVCVLPLTEFPNGGGCLPGGNVPAGDYEYKVRFSVDGGSTWTWIGASDGSNLKVHYDPNCPFAENDSTQCFSRGGVL